MMRETAKKYYLEQNYNCAESVLRAANEEYGLGLDEGALKLMAGFGGGMGCGGVCGALSGGIAALSKLRVSDRAHTTPGFSGECARLVAAFEDAKKVKNQPVLFDIKVLPKTMTDGYGSWWRVGDTEVSERQENLDAYASHMEHVKDARKY